MRDVAQSYCPSLLDSPPCGCSDREVRRNGVRFEKGSSAGQGVLAMRQFLRLTLTIVALVVSTPCVTHAGGRFGMSQGHAFREPSSSISRFPMSPRAHRRFDRNPFGGAAVIPWDPFDTDVAAVPPDVPVIVRNVAPPEPEPPMADPKFVFPPAP